MLITMHTIQLNLTLMTKWEAHEFVDSFVKRIHTVNCVTIQYRDILPLESMQEV